MRRQNQFTKRRKHLRVDAGARSSPFHDYRILNPLLRTTVRALFTFSEKPKIIAEFLTTHNSDNTGVSPAEFAEKFGMKMEEAVVFLEWIKVGIKFKEESIDAAEKSGFGGPVGKR